MSNDRYMFKMALSCVPCTHIGEIGRCLQTHEKNTSETLNIVTKDQM